MITFKELEKAALSITERSYGSWGYHAITIVLRAADNADDTVYVEKTASVEEYDSIALATVGGLLANETFPAETIKWFIEQGVRF